MATGVTVGSSYVGEFAGEYIGDALLTANSLENGTVMLKPSIVGTRVVKTLELGTSLLQDASCDFTDNSSVTIAERNITPKLMKINLQDCKQNYIDDWEVKNMGMSAHKNYPKAVSDFIIQRILGRTAADIETKIWQGVDGAGSFDGFQTLLAADVNVIDVATPIAITSANVIGELSRNLALVPVAVRDQPNFRMAVSSNVYNAYAEALGGFVAAMPNAGVSNLGTTGYNSYATNGVIPFVDTIIVKCNGMTDNTIVSTYTENLWFGTALQADFANVQVIDMAFEGSENVRFISKFSAAVQYGFGGDIVFTDGSLVV